MGTMNYDRGVEVGRQQGFNEALAIIDAQRTDLEQLIQGRFPDPTARLSQIERLDRANLEAKCAVLKGAARAIAERKRG